MLERWCEKLVALGKAHPKLRWPLVALMALLYGGAAVCDRAKALAYRLISTGKHLGTELSMLSREAAAHLKETGEEIAGGLHRLYRSYREHLRPLVRTRGREVWNTSRKWCLNHLRAAFVRGRELAQATAHGASGLAQALRAELPALRGHAPRRALALALALCMTFSLLPVSALGAEAQGCDHVHDESCGYVEAVEGAPCTHTEHDENCGYVEAVPEVPCDQGCTDTDGDGVIDHVPGCAYTPAAESQPCKHELGEHDESCGYIEAVAGSPCTHEHDETCGGMVSTEDDTYVPPEQTEECTCGAVPDADGVTIHAPDCPLYIPPETAACEFCGEEGHTSDHCPYEAHTCLLCGGDHATYECPRFDPTQEQQLQEAVEEGGEGSYEDIAALVAALPALEDVLALDPRDADGMEALGDCYAAVRAVWDAMFLLPPAEYRRAEDDFALTLGALEDAALAAFDALGISPMSNEAKTDQDYDYEGNGTATSPYLISNEGQLYDLAKTVNAHSPQGSSLAECQQMQGVYFKLTADIDVGTGSQDNRYSKWLPIGFNEKEPAYSWPVFAGTFDGDGYKVSGIRRYIGDFGQDQVLKDYGGLMGLFGSVSGVVKNVIIDDSVIGSNTDDFLDMIIGGDPSDADKLSASADSTAAVAVSVVSSAGRIENCSTTKDVTVRAFGSAAGIVVSNAGSVVFCENNAKIESRYSAAGIATSSGSQGRVEYCVNRGQIYSLGQAAGEVAGVVGTSSGDVIACRNEGEVTTEGYSSVLGGVVGDAYGGTCSSCCNLGAVSGDGAAVGGIVGRVVEKTVVRNSYNAGEVTGGEDTHRTVVHRNMCASLYKWYPSTLGQIVGEDTSAPYKPQGDDFGAISTSGSFICDNGIYPASNPPYVGSSGVYENVHYNTASGTQPMGWDRQGLTCDHALFGRNLKNKYQGYPKPENVDATKASGSFSGGLAKSVLEAPSYAAMEALWKDQDGLPVQERSYLVQLRGNGGKVEGETLLGGGRVPEGTLVSLTGHTATYDKSHNFMGWSLVPDGEVITGSYTVNPKDATGGYIILYAKWASTRSDHLTLVDPNQRYDAGTNPVAVTSAMDLNYISYQRSRGDKVAVYWSGGVLYDTQDATAWSYRVTADLDFTDIPYESMTGIGADQSFDGGGHTVSNLQVPLFTWAKGAIRDLNFADCAIEGAGALAERGENATVSGCTVADSVSVTFPAGGWGTPVGGLIGNLESGAVYDCASMAAVVNGGSGPTGGLVGGCSGGVYNSYSGAAPSGKVGSPVGGLVGSVNNGGVVENCYFYRYEADGKANFPDQAGLIAGSLSGRLNSCFAVGSDKALFADKSSSASLSNCASSLTDRLTAQLADSGARDEYPLSDLLNSYVFANKTARAYSGWAVFPGTNHGYPVHAAGSINPLFSTDSGWTVTEGGIVTGTVPTDPWTGHAETPSQGADGVYYIGTPGQLAHVAANPGTYASATLILTADLDLSQYVWAPITGFGGVFDGRGHVISGLYTTAGDKAGLFAAVTTGGTVKNLGVDQSYFLAATAAGAIAAENAGTILNCWSLAYVNAATAGGIAGTNSGSVSRVSAAGNVGGKAAGAVTGDGGTLDNAWFRADRASQTGASGYAATGAAATAAALTIENWQTAGLNSWEADESRGFPVFAFQGALTPVTVRFDANGGTLGGEYPEQPNLLPGTVLDLSGYTATGKENQLFLGWAPKADAAAGAKQYTVRAEDGTNGVVTLYAVLRDTSDCLWPLDRSAAYSANNPLVISSVKDWGLFRAAIADGDNIQYYYSASGGAAQTGSTDARTANYKLTADLDFGGEAWTAVAQYGGDAAANPVFDGGGHTLRGITSAKESVFALVKNATVQNLSIADSTVAGGGLVDVLEDGTVRNCHARSGVSVTTAVQDGVEKEIDESWKIYHLRAHAGGIVGMATGTAACTIRDCTSAAAVTIRVDEDHITLTNGTTKYSYYPYLYTGGIVGRVAGRTDKEGQPAFKVALSDCTNLGPVTSSGTEAKKAPMIYHYAGGIVGTAYRTVALTPSPTVELTRCANRGAVEAATTRDFSASLSMEHYVGGLAGSLPSGSLSGCGSRGAVTVTVKGEDAYVEESSWPSYIVYTGGLVGKAGASGTSDTLRISKCFNTGNVTIDSKFNGKDVNGDASMLYVKIKEQYVGGLVGDYTALAGGPTMSDCFNWGDVSSDAPRRSTDKYCTVYIGGAIGHTRAAAAAEAISRVYSIGDVTYRYEITNPTPDSAVFITGLLGNDNFRSSEGTVTSSITLSNCHVLKRDGKSNHWDEYYADSGASSSSFWKSTGISLTTPQEATNGTLLGKLNQNGVGEKVWAAYDGSPAYPVFASTGDNVWSQEATAPPQSADGTPAISYVLNGGVNRAGNLDTVGKMAGRSPQDPTRAGCAFLGWYLDSGEQFTGPFTGRETDAVTLTAKWKYKTPAAVRDWEVSAAATVLTVSGVSGQEYCCLASETAGFTDAAWSPCADGSAVTFSGLTANTTYYLYTRMPGDGTTAASDPSPALAVSTPATNPSYQKPTALTAEATDTTITITGVTPADQTYEFAINSSSTISDEKLAKLDWQMERTFTGLNPDGDPSGDDYYVLVRVAGTTGRTYLYIKPEAVRTAPLPPDAPALEFEAVGTESVTIKTVDGAEYRLGDGVWQDGNTFTGLTPATAYSFAIRIKETGTAAASPETRKTVYTLVPEGTGYTVDYVSELFFVEEGYTLKRGDTVLPSGSAAEPGGTYTICYDRNPELTAAFTLPERPGQPTTLIPQSASTQFSADGAITGVTAGMEYGKAGAPPAYTAVTPTEQGGKTLQAGLLPGSYVVRYAATDHSFRSLAATVTVTVKPSTTTYTVVFKNGETVLLRLTNLAYGAEVSAPTAALTPPEEGMLFTGWYSMETGKDEGGQEITAQLRWEPPFRLTPRTGTTLTLNAGWVSYADLFVNADLSGWHNAPINLLGKAPYATVDPAAEEPGNGVLLDVESETAVGSAQTVYVSSGGSPFPVEITYYLDTKTPAAPTVSTKEDNGTAYTGEWTARDVTFTLSGTPTVSGHATYQYTVDNGATWQNVTGNALTHTENTPETGVSYQFRAVNNAGTAGAASEAVTVKRNRLSDTELAATQYGKDDLSISPPQSQNDWYNELPTVTVTKKETVGTGGLSATTYYELYKDPTESGDKTKLDGTGINITEDGVWTLKIWTEDAAGNHTAPYKIVLKVDTTAPVITVTDETNGEVVGSWGPEREITFTVADNLSGVIFVSHCGNRVGNNDNIEMEVSQYGSYTFTALVSDSYTIMATDEAGNVTSHGFITQQLDGTAPTAQFGTFEGTQGENGWYTDTVTVNVTVEDPENTPDVADTPINESDRSGIKSWEYSLDGGEHWTEMAADATSFTIDVDGDYADKVQLQATDNAGNVSETATASVKLDKSTPAAPTVTAKAAGADYDGDFTAKPVVMTATATCSVTSGVTLQYKQGDGQWVNASTVTHEENTGDEGVTYTFRALSGAGAASTEVTKVVKFRALDGSATDDPANKYGQGDFSISGEGVKDGWYTEDVTVTVTKKTTITDGTTDYPADTWYKVDDGEKVKLDGSTIGITGDGAHTLEIWTEDAAGNETTHLTLTVKIDKTAPTITGVTGNPENWQKDDADITFTVDDETSGVASVTVTCGDGQSVTCTSGGFTADRNGTYTITVTDNAGNTETKDVSVTRVDPSIPAKPTVTGYTSDTWVKENITFALSTTDTAATVLSGTRFQVKVGSADWADVTGSTYAVTENKNGVAYSFRAISGAGTPSEAVDFTVKLDKTAPVVSLDVQAGGAAYNGSTFTAHDVVITPSNTAQNISGATYFYRKTDDADWTELAGDTLTVNYNCNTTFTFKAVSGAGAESSNQPTAQVKRSAMSDEELAKTEYGESDFTISPAPNEDGWYNAFPTVTVLPKDTVGTGDGALVATTYYELYKAPAVSGTKTALADPWQIKPDSDGIWTLNIWTEDEAGNHTKTYSITIQVDTAPPTITGVTGNPTEWQKADVTLTVNDAADATSGLAALAYSFDGGVSWQTENAKTYAANTTVTVWVRDKAGNTCRHTPIAIDRIDKTAPVVGWDAATAAIDPNKWYGKTALTATATDDSGEAPAITLTSGGKTYENGYIIDATGSYTFTATAKDGAGNVGRSASLTVRIETAIDEFVAKVGQLDDNSRYQDILDAKTWHDGQSQTVKDRFSKSDEAIAAYEKLLGLLRDKAQEAANGVTEAIKEADTIEKIEQAAKDYDALPDEAKDQVPGDVKDELAKKKQDADAAQKVIEQLANADRDKNGKDPGGSYEEKQAALDAYGKLTEAQKALVDQVESAVADKESVNADLSAIDGVLDLLGKIKKPYTPATKEQIKAAGDAYNALTQKQKDAFPKADKAKLDTLETMREHAQAVEDKIKALGDNATLEQLTGAKGAYDSLTADEKAMVAGADELNRKYQAKLDQMDADEKAAAEFAAKVEEVKNSPTVEKIEQLIKDHDALSDAAKDNLTEQTTTNYEKLVDDLNKAKEVIDKLDGIDVGTLTPDDMTGVKDVLDKYSKLDPDQKKLVDKATDGKPGILDEAVKGVEDATGKIEGIPSHGADSTTTLPDGETVPNLGDCENAGNANAGNTSTTGGHTYEDHKNAIEEAKIAYEKLTDAGRKLISDEAKEKLNREYAALMAYLEYINTAKTATTNVEVAGLAEKVELPTESASAPKTVVSVVMADSKPEAMPPVPAGKTEALSVDIKLVASIYDDPDAAEATAVEQVQPKAGEQVLVKLKVPAGYQNDTLELWHIKDNGGRSRIEDFWLVTETDGTYTVFEVRSFSHFVFFAEKETTGGGGGGSVTPPVPKPDITDSDHGSATVSPQQPRPGTTVTIRPEPDEGYVVDEVVVTDRNGKEIPVKDNADGTWSYTQPNGKVTVTVTFKPEPQVPDWPFTDVKPGDWFYENVKYVYEQGLMMGTASDKFSPYLDTSRGMIVTILWRLEGEPESMNANPFPDVAPGAYYTKAVAWGAENGIVKGYGNGNFGPNDPITREQLAAILYRFAQFKNVDVSASGTLSAFTDAAEVSGYAQEAMRWAVEQGIIAGRGNGILDPRGLATRAETAAMLQRYLTAAEK